MSLKHHLRILLSWLGWVYVMALTTSSAQAAELALADQPLFLGTQIDPNVFFMMDDSGSMDWEILTRKYNYYTNYWSSGSTVSVVESGYFLGYSSSGSCTGRRDNAYIYDSDAYSNGDNVYDSCNYATVEDHTEAYVRDWRVYNADFNVMYYNPEVTYSPWQGFPDASFTAARSNPQSGSSGYNRTRNLEGFIYEVWDDNLGYDNDDDDYGTVEGPDSVTDGANGRVDLWDNHTKYTVGSTSVSVSEYTTTFAGVDGSPNCDYNDAIDSPPYVDCFGTSESTSSISGATNDPYGRTITQIKQNIANWYQYHRRRSFVSKGAVDLVVNSNRNFRFGYSQINDYGSVFVEVPSVVIDDYSSHNQDLLEEMFDYAWGSNSTPLRRGLERVGRYYDDTLSGFTDPIISECQQNYAVLFTDGEYNGSNPVTGAIGDEDGDGVSDSLADVAMYFYEKDLSPLDNDVPETPIDPNTAQHMVSFTVAFGLQGNLVDTDGDGYPNPELDSDDAWHEGTSINTLQEKVDDMWHAAFNSKAYYVAAQSPEEVASAIASALLEIADRVGSAASVATNTGSLNAGSKLFQARFDSSDWKGQLLAYQINPDGTIDDVEAWEAGDELNAQHWDTGREIITFNPDIDDPVGGIVEGKGIAFRFPADYTSPSGSTEMTDEQIEYLLTSGPYDADTVDTDEINDNQDFGQDLLDYLRGDDSNELTGQNFRLRNSILGDIVNSDPRFVDVPNFRYPDAIAAKSYAAFVTANASRQGVVYVGANDGMLHAFNADTGEEMLAYVPNAVFNNLYRLADVDYEHRYFVDGGPNIIDVYFPNTLDPDTSTVGVWKTVVAGGLGGGGQAIYALDGTDPDDFDEANAADLVLWEFDDEDDEDLGYTYGKVQMAKMNDGTWAAVFGNGYNNTEDDGTYSTTGHAVLYIIDIETGEILKKLDTEAGDAATPNGLATPLMIDVGEDPDDQTVDYIYAGDLLGNLWKFDVSDDDPANWDVAWDSGGPQPLFTTKTDQPITSQPQVTFHPDNLQGFMVYFGTGQYIEETDNIGSGQTTQAFYGIWDRNTSAVPSIDPDTDLLLQNITEQYDQEFDTDGDNSPDTTFSLREVSDNLINWATHDGFRLDLYPLEIEGTANTDNFGERQVSNPIVRNGRVIFTTLIPSDVECEFGGTSYVMEIDFRDGSALEFPAFDLNNDGEYDADDTLAAGRASDVGIMPTVSILSDGAQDVAFGSGASGAIDVIEISVGDQSFGRQSWRQLE